MAIEHVGGIIIDGVSMAADITPKKGDSEAGGTKIFDISDAYISSLEVSAPSATHVGVLTVEVSNSGGDDSWTVLHTLTAPSSGSAVLEFKDIATGAKYLRVHYVVTSGIGALTVIAVKKTRT